MKYLPRILKYVVPHWRWAMLSLAMWGVSAAMDLLVPQIVARIIDEGIIGRDAARLGALVALVAVFIALRGLSHFGMRFAMRWYETRVSHRIRQDFYEKLQQLPYAYYDRMDSGEVITRAISDVNNVRMFTGNGVMETVRIFGIFIVILIGMAFTNMQLTLLAIAVLVAMGVLATWYGRTVRPVWLALQQQMSVVTKVLSENLNGIRVVKAFAHEPAEIAAFEREAEELLERGLRPARMRARFIPAVMFLTGLGTVLVLWVGGRMALDGTLSVGTLVAFYYYFARLTGPTRMLGFLVQRYARAVSSGQRVFELLDQPVPIASRPGAVIVDQPRGELKFERVSLAYHRNRPVLHEIDVRVPAGAVVGIVGPTGAGKTSLASLVGRYYEASTGRVTLDGVDVRDHELTALRRQVAIVPQETFLFSDTVRNNLAYSEPDAAIDRVIEAAKDAQAYQFITDMPEGFETVVGERGIGLSGGQRQRLTIGRAMLSNAAVLILDDATSSVDTETERRLQAALARHSKGRTTLIISQRVSAVEHADEILVLDDGRLVDQGTHADLVARSGFYRDLYELQRAQTSETRAELARPESHQTGNA